MREESARRLELLGLPQPPDGGPDGGTGRRRERPRATGDLDAAVLHVAEPDADGVAPHGLLEMRIELVLS